MARVVSEDALRRALQRIDEPASAAWMRPSLMHSVREALERPWVLDIDARFKPLYGRQEGAEIGYNPSKPMRPSHVLHTFLVSNLRLVLDVQLSSGKQHTSMHAKTALGRLLDELGERRPALVRGDSGYGNEGIVECFGALALIQRCQEHKRRNVIEHLPQELHANVGRALRDAWDGANAELARKQLQRLAASLNAKHPGAATSLREGLEDTSTVQTMGITGALYRTLRTTNPIENLNGSIAHFTRNVKRWKDGQMTLRWIAGALSDTKGRFRKLRGHRDMKLLLAALKAKSANVIDAERKAA